MKINVSQKKTPERPRPSFPSVRLTDEAYDALNELSVKHNVSMRMLASAIIINTKDNLEVIQGGERDG